MRRIILLLICFVLSACSLFNVEKQNTRILLEVPHNTVQKETTQKTITLTTLAINPILDTSAILVVSDNLLTKFKGAVWAESTPIMLQYLLLNTLRTSAISPSISTDSEGILSEYFIENTLKKWYVVRTKDGYSVVGALYSSIVQKRKSITIAQKSWEITKPLKNITTHDIYTTFQSVFDEIAMQWLQWIRTNLQ